MVSYLCSFPISTKMKSADACPNLYLECLTGFIVLVKLVIIILYIYNNNNNNNNNKAIILSTMRTLLITIPLPAQKSPSFMQSRRFTHESFSYEFLFQMHGRLDSMWLLSEPSNGASSQRRRSPSIPEGSIKTTDALSPARSK